MSLPLRIFEERYKLMLEDIQQSDSSFGVVLIKEGGEVGDPAAPYSEGTVARIVEVGPEEGGQIHLMAVGEQRFRIEETLRERPYIIARVELLAAEVSAEVPTELVTQVREAFQKYVQAAMGLRGGWSEKVEFPSDPVHLSYFIGGALQVEAGLRQGLLETSSCAARLQNELDILTQSTSQLKERVQQEWSRNRFSKN
jgi:Lon protease-like protein